MTSSTNNINADVSMNSQKLEEVTSFKYLEATLCKDGTCSAEVPMRNASAMAAVARMNKSAIELKSVRLVSFAVINFILHQYHRYYYMTITFPLLVSEVK